MGCRGIISAEETKQKMVCISFHWEQKNRINYSPSPTLHSSELAWKASGKTLFSCPYRKRQKWQGVGILPQRA